MQVIDRVIQNIDTMKSEINTLARELYLMHGHHVAASYDFSQPRSELARKCWNSAVIVHFNMFVKEFDDDEVAAFLLPK